MVDLLVGEAEPSRAEAGVKTGPLENRYDLQVPLRRAAAFAILCLSAFAADPVPITAPQLILLSKTPTDPAFAAALHTVFKDQQLLDGKAAIGRGPDFLWAIDSATEPLLLIDDAPYHAMLRIKGTNLWFQTGHLTTGTSHTYYYTVDGARKGGSYDLAAYGPDSYEQDVPHGKMSAKLQFTSKIFDGMVCDYWIYVPAGYDPQTPAALMIWQDGHGFVDRDGGSHLANVIDNLIAQKKIPVMIQLLIDPGKLADKPLRSVEYDTVSDRYPRFLRDEMLPLIEKQYNIRKDGYSRAIGGESSGGICAFNAAWYMPEQFSRVFSRIGSFTSIQWHPGELEGGDIYPFKIRKEKNKRDIRVWLQDGSEDLENEHGSWPLQNLEMANSLKRMNYDFHLSFGSGTHNTAQGNAQMPEALTWLWRDYDASKQAQEFTMDPEEQAKPLFRVRVYNR